MIMQNEKEELDNLIDLFYDKVDVMALFDKIQFNFDEIIRASTDEVSRRYPEWENLVKVSEYYSDVVYNLLETCKDFVHLYEDDKKISARRILNLFDTVQFDIVGINEQPSSIPEIELIDPRLEPSVRELILEIALKVIDKDINVLSKAAQEKINDIIILEMERRKLKDEGVI